MNFRISCILAATAVAAFSAPAQASGRIASNAERFDAPITRLSRAHGVPERLIRRVIMRESRYAPRATNRGHYGLMQIKLATAKGMGYRGGAGGLLDGETNLTYAVPYLANAYMAAEGNEDRAVALYAGGYYYVAKRKGLLGDLRTANSAPLAGEPVVAYAAAPQPQTAPAQTSEAQQADNPFAALFGGAQPSAQMIVIPEGDDSQMEPVEIALAPLPPRRPRGL